MYKLRKDKHGFWVNLDISTVGSGDENDRRWRFEAARQLLLLVMTEEKADQLIQKSLINSEWYDRTRTIILPEPFEIEGSPFSLIHVRTTGHGPDSVSSASAGREPVRALSTEGLEGYTPYESL